jgi:hypothetical protein
MQPPMQRLCNSAIVFATFFTLPLYSQQTELQLILERLDRLERQNRELMEEMRALRMEVAARRGETEAAGGRTLSERVEVQERRVEEQAQTKVESGQKLPVRLTGMVLFNAFLNGRYSGGVEAPTIASAAAGPALGGGTVRQSTVNLEFDGGQTFAGGKLSGSLNMDFFAGTTSTLNHNFRIRTGAAQIDWSRTTLLVGQLKPIFSPRDPTSLSQVGVSPLTGAGNPWLWQPQVRVHQRFSLGEQTELRAQVGILQTNELAANVPAEFASTLERARPALEGRFEFRRPNLEIAPGFHISRTHVAGTSVPSNAISIDWFYSPVKKVEFTGFAFKGANIANTGTLRQGFSILGPRNAIPIRSRGGWAQLAILPASRISLHLIAGQQDDSDSDLRFSGIGKNQAYAANIMYRISSNMIISLERSQLRTSYLSGPVQSNVHHDLAFAYLF